MKTSELVVVPAREADVFPEDGRRALVYVIYDRRGDVEGYITHALKSLREYVHTIVAVVNGGLSPQGAKALEGIVDEVIERENRGYDIWGYKAGLDALSDRLDSYDEVILANDTWYGPVQPFAPVFSSMDKVPLHFWGMTDHVRVEPNPFTGDGYLPYHLQSYWLVVRKRMFTSEEWLVYWRDLPELERYEDAVVKHEAVFTETFTAFGFVGEVAFPTLTDRIENHAVLYAEQLVEAGCPTLKRRAFFQWPPYLDHLGVVGKWALDAADRHGYPMNLIWTDLARNVAPRTLNADAALMNVISSKGGVSAVDADLRVVVIAHVFYMDMLAEIVDRADLLPGSYDLVITVPDEEKAALARRDLAARASRGAIDVRVLGSNAGRDQGAFLVACRDVVLDGGYDLVVKLHSKKSPQDASNAATHFKEHQFDNLLPDATYASNLLAIFQREAQLGIVYPPMVHIGYGTVGHAWWANRPAFIAMCKRLGIHVPVDGNSPLAPYGSMYIARPSALAPLFRERWTYDDFGGDDAYVDGGLAHVMERMPSYAAGEAGFYTRTVASERYVAASYTALEYDLDQFTSTMPDSTMHQIQFLRRLGQLGAGRLEDFAYIFARLRAPHAEPRLQRLFAVARGARRQLRRGR